MDLLTLGVNVGIALVSAVFAAGGAYVAVKVRLYYIEKRLDRHESQIDDLWQTQRQDVDRIHSRINALSRGGA